MEAALFMQLNRKCELSFFLLWRIAFDNGGQLHISRKERPIKLLVGIPETSSFPLNVTGQR